MTALTSTGTMFHLHIMQTVFRLAGAVASDRRGVLGYVVTVHSCRDIRRLSLKLNSSPKYYYWIINETPACLTAGARKLFCFHNRKAPALAAGALYRYRERCLMQKTEKIASLRKQALALPTQPGVYLMKDIQGNIIYIGKAKHLKNRVSQYFGSDTGHSEKVRRMVSQIDRFEYIVTDSEFEALVLECSLIKQYSPKYNILLKDDKGYRYIRISPPPYSRISVALQKPNDGARYLGPYISGFVVKEAVDEVCRIFQLPTCTRTLGKDKGGRPCLNHYIGQCCAPLQRQFQKKTMTMGTAGNRVHKAVQSGSVDKRMNQAAETLSLKKPHACVTESVR